MSELQTATLAATAEPHLKASRGRHFFLVAALLLLTIGTVFRVYHLGDRSLWFDEALSADISRGTLTQALAETRARGSQPVVHPYILYLVQKISKSAAAVRTPSVLASLLAVFVMLAMVRVKVSRNAALFSAAILTISVSQIRYAQEVREYSLSVLCAATLVFCLLRWETAGSRSRRPISLYALLFVAPLIQYGLVFLAFGILSTIGLRLLLTRDTSFRLSHLVTGSAALVVGGLSSLILTLRYQYRPNGFWYLATNYFDPKTTNIFHFLSANTSGLLSFTIPGHVIRLCFECAAVIFCIVQVVNRKCQTITLLVFTTMSITICAALVRVYPYGGIRQCLFLAPVLTLFAGVAFADLLQRLRRSLQPLAAVGLIAFILFSCYRGMLGQWPYSEYEDTVSILKELAKASGPNDQVWVNHDAVPAVEFYLQEKDHRFIDGKFHEDARQYVPELLGSIDPHSDRVWLVFSHLQQQSDRAEQQLIVSSLQSGWEVSRVMAPTNTELYVAHRRTSSLHGVIRSKL
jgi:4-amino-4-deoxy-L-arabinose transferase-like glycosyltransferase